MSNRYNRSIFYIIVKTWLNPLPTQLFYYILHCNDKDPCMAYLFSLVNSYNLLIIPRQKTLFLSTKEKLQLASPSDLYVNVPPRHDVFLRNDYGPCLILWLFPWLIETHLTLESRCSYLFASLSFIFHMPREWITSSFWPESMVIRWFIYL